jgi:hypothetical protein
MTADGRDDRVDDEMSEAEAAGADLIGAVAGGAFGLIGGPVGALGGAALGVAIQRATKAAIARMSRAEQRRVAETIEQIADDRQLRADAGESLRDDGFFDDREGDRPAAEELLEGVLRFAAETYEERKLPLLGHLYDGVAHDESIPPADALFLLRAAASLTYRQFVALAVIARAEELGRELAWAKGRRDEGRVEPDPAVLMELDDLGDRRVVGLRVKGTVRAVGEVIDSSSPLSVSEYAAWRLLPAGERLMRLTRASSVISTTDQDAWLVALKREPK